MSLSTLRDYIVSVVPGCTVHRENRIFSNVRFAVDVVAAADGFLRLRKVPSQGMRHCDFALSACNDLFRIGIISHTEPGKYKCITRSSECLLFVHSGTPTKSLARIRGSIPWVKR